MELPEHPYFYVWRGTWVTKVVLSYYGVEARLREIQTPLSYSPLTALAGRGPRGGGPKFPRNRGDPADPRPGPWDATAAALRPGTAGNHLRGRCGAGLSGAARGWRGPW